MRNDHYILNGQSLRIDGAACVGCGACVAVCPHGVLELRGRADGDAAGRPVATIADRKACMECGACAKNCPSGAIDVKTGVGCAQAILIGKLRGTEPECGCGSGKGCC